MNAKEAREMCQSKTNQGYGDILEEIKKYIKTEENPLCYIKYHKSLTKLDKTKLKDLGYKIKQKEEIVDEGSVLPSTYYYHEISW